jgi:hypothetical protein
LWHLLIQRYKKVCVESVALLDENYQEWNLENQTVVI